MSTQAPETPQTPQAPQASASTRSNPYVGPESFRRGDRIYGRDRAAAELLDLLVAERVVLLHSPSGAGKTSLIQARMLSLLEEDNFAVLPIARLNHDVPAELADGAGPVNRYVLSALTSLEEGLPEGSQTPLATLAGLTLAEYVARRPRADDHPGSTVLIIDQFEEVITADPVDQVTKRAFFRQLGELLGDRSVWALLSMREDFLAELDPYARLVPTRFTNRYRLDLLTEAEALDAVIYPARDAGVDFEAPAAGKLVDDLRTVRLQRGNEVLEELGPYVEPVQLQVVCRGVWGRKSPESSRIGLSDVDEVGNVDEALAAYYADCMTSTAAASGVPERALREWCEQQLITPQGFRGQAMHGPETVTGSSEQVLDLLTSAHLLRAESRRGAVWFELAHDRLIDPVKEDNERWRRTNLSDVERRAELWEDQSRSDGLLLTGAELVEAEAWAATRSGSLTEVERDYLTASRRLAEQAQKEARANKRIRRWLVVAVVGFVLAVIASAFAISSTNRANEASLRASEAAALGQSVGNLKDDVQLSLRLAIKASALRDSDSGALSNETMAVLQQAVDASPVLVAMRGTTSPAGEAFHSRAGSRILSLHEDGTLRVWDAVTGRLVWSQPGGEELMASAISADGARVAVGTPDGVRLWDVGSGSGSDSGAPKLLLAGMGVEALSFSPDGAWLVAREAPEVSDETGTMATEEEPEPDSEPTDDGHLLAVSLPDGVSRDLPAGGGWRFEWLGEGAWSPKGARLVSVGDGRVKVWDSPTAEPRVIAFPEDSMDMTFSQMGGVVAVQQEKAVAVLRGLGGKQIALVPGGWGQMSLSRDGRLLLLSDFGDSVSVFDTANGAFVSSASQPGTSMQLAELNPADPGKALVSGTEGELTIWDVRSGRAGEENISSFTMGADVGVTLGETNTARFWDSSGASKGSMNLYARLGLKAPDPDASLEDPDADPGVFISLAAPSPTGTFVAVTTDQDGPGYLVPVDPKQKVGRLATADPTHTIVSLGVSRTGRYVVGGYTTSSSDEAFGDEAGPEAVTGEPLLGGEIPDSPPVPTVGSSTAESPTADSEEPSGGIYVWDAATGKVLHRWPQERGEPYVLEVSPDEREVLGFVEDHAAIWDLATGKVRLTINPAPENPSTATLRPEEEGEGLGGPTFVTMAWGAQSNLIAMSQDDNLLGLWDARSGTRVAVLKKHASGVASLDFDATGGRLVSVGEDQTIVVWDVETRSAAQQVRHEGVMSAQFAQTARRVLVVDNTGVPSLLWLDGRELLDAAKSRTSRELTPEECSRYLGEEDICRTG